MPARSGASANGFSDANSNSSQSPPANGVIGSGDFGFIYVQLRMGRGRSAAVHQRAGEALAGAARQHFAPLMAHRKLGLTVQIDEGQEVFDAKLGNLHPMFSKA